MTEKIKIENELNRLISTERRLTDVLHHIQDDLYWSKCISQREFLAYGKVKIYEYVHKYIDSVEIELQDKTRMIKVHPADWLKSTTRNFVMSGRGSRFRLIQLVDEIEIDCTNDEYFCIDWISMK